MNIGKVDEQKHHQKQSAQEVSAAELTPHNTVLGDLSVNTPTKYQAPKEV